MPGNTANLRAADSDASRQSPTEDSSSAVAECPLMKKKREQEQLKKKLTLKLAGRDGPYRNVRYELLVDGQMISAPGAVTQDNGLVDEDISTDSQTGELRVWFDQFEQPEIYRLVFKPFQPVDTDEGFLDRVRALGILPDDQGKLSLAAIRELQRMLGLAETGTVDDNLRNTVKARHGS